MINPYLPSLHPGDPLRLLDEQLRQPALPLIVCNHVFLLAPCRAELADARLARAQRHVVSVRARHHLHVGFIFPEASPTLWPDFAGCRLVALGRQERALWLAPYGGEHLPLWSLPELTFADALPLSEITTVSFHVRQAQRLVHLGDKPALAFF